MLALPRPRHPKAKDLQLATSFKYSYYQKYGGCDERQKQYCLRDVDGESTSSWYDEDELTLAGLAKDPILGADLVG